MHERPGVCAHAVVYKGGFTVGNCAPSGSGMDSPLTTRAALPSLRHSLELKGIHSRIETATSTTSARDGRQTRWPLPTVQIKALRPVRRTNPLRYNRIWFPSEG